MEVRQVTKAKAKSYKVKLKMQIDYFGNENAIRNTFARMMNALSGSELDKITAGKLRGVENYII